MHAAKLKTANKKSLITNKSTALQNSTKRDPLVEKVSQMGNTRNPQEHAAVLKHAPANQQASNQQLLLMLQQQYGNDYVNQVLEIAQGDREETPATAEAETTEQPVVQAKMAMGQVGDKYEQEADRTAHQVIQKMSESETVSEEDRVLVEEETESPQIQQKCGCGGKENIQKKSDNTLQPEETEDVDTESSMEERSQTDTLDLEDAENEDLIIQRKPKEQNAEATPDLTRSLQQQKGKGQPLANPLKQEMEGAFGKDFSGVKIHTDTEADRLTRSIKARAFTIRQDIFFRQGEYTPESKQGQELLAHELTHVVQQGGSGDKSSEDAGVKVSEVPEDMGIQRACAQCEEEKAEGMIQAKKESGTADKAETSLEGCNQSPSAEVPEEASIEQAESSGGCGKNKPEDSQNAESDTSECDQENSSDENIDNGQGEGEPEKQPQPCPSETEESSEHSEPEEIQPEKGKLNKSAKCESKATQKGDRPQQNASPLSWASILIPTPTNSTAKQQDEKINKREKSLAEKTPQTPTSEIKPQGAAKRDRANNLQAATAKQNAASEPAIQPETIKEEVELPINSKEGSGLKTTNAKIARLASAQIDFKLPRQEESNSDNAALEEQRATSSSMASNFFTDAATRVQKVTGLGKHISGRINKSSAKAKAAILSTVKRQKATVKAQIEHQRTQLQDQAQATIAEIENQHQATLENISQQTKTTSQQIQTEYNNTFERLDAEKSTLLGDIDAVYSQTYKEYIAAGEEVGEKAIKTGDKYAKQYRAEAEQEREENIKIEKEILEKIKDSQGSNSQTSTERTSFGGIESNSRDRNEESAEKEIEKHKDTLTKNEEKISESNIKAAKAREVAEEYQKQVKNAATKQANQLAEGKEKDVKGICCGIQEIYQKLQTNQEETLNCLTKFEQDTVSEVTEVKTELTESADQTLEASLESLDQQETALMQILQGYGDRQIKAIDRDSQKAIASIEKGVNQAATELLTALQSYYDEFQDMEAPLPDDLKVTLAEILQEFDSSIITIEGETEKAITASTQSIKQGEQQVVGAVNTVAQSAIEEIGIVAEEAKANLANLKQGVTDIFQKLQDIHTEVVNKFVENTATGLAKTQPEGAFENIYQKLSTALEESVPCLKKGLEEILKCLVKDIQNYAEQAVKDAEQAVVSFLLKALVVVAAIAIAIFAAPLLMGALAVVIGTSAIATVVAGIVVGAALGALSQIANNAIDGKDLLEGVGEAALKGAIGGAIGGFGGALGGLAGQAGKLGVGLTKSFTQYGIETALDAVGEVAGNLATDEAITAQGILMGVAIGTAVHVSTTKAHGINKRAETANTFSKRPDLVNKLPNMKPDEINVLAKETGMNPAELKKLAKMKPEELKKYVDNAKQRTSQQDNVTLKLAQSFEKMQRRGYQFGQQVGSKVTQPIKNTFSSKQQSDHTTTRSDADTSRGLKSDTDVPMTPRERDILANTSPKRGDELTSEELKTELDVAGKAKPESINDGEFIEQRELPNNHEWKQKEDGTLCRFSGEGICFPNKTINRYVENDNNVIKKVKKQEYQKEHDRGVEFKGTEEEGYTKITIKKNVEDWEHNFNILDRQDTGENITLSAKRDFELPVSCIECAEHIVYYGNNSNKIPSWKKNQDKSVSLIFGDKKTINISDQKIEDNISGQEKSYNFKSAPIKINEGLLVLNLDSPESSIHAVVVVAKNNETGEIIVVERNAGTMSGESDYVDNNWLLNYYKNVEDFKQGLEEDGERIIGKLEVDKSNQQDVKSKRDREQDTETDDSNHKRQKNLQNA